jgi:hypothetical protein
MKKLFLLLLIIAPALASTQNFTNICSQGPAFYKKYNSNIVKAFKYTSYTLPGGGDTIFYTFPTIRDTAATCKDTTEGSILGRKIYRQSASYLFFFFNKNNDTIYINAKALVNDTWRFVKLTLGTYLEAKVISIAPDSVINVLDDVMTIQLQAKRLDGTVIANPWNGKTLKLSKRYGLSKTYDFTNMPADTTSYTLAGKLKPVIGIQDFGWREIYDFNIGDEFHYSGYTNSTTGSPNTTWKEIQTVFSKNTYGANNDSVVYKFDRCRSTITNPGNTLVYFRDTITVKYKFNVMAGDSSIMRYPDQFKRQNVYASQFDRYMKVFNNRQTKKITEDKYRFLNNCFLIPSGSVTLYRNYSEGLGITEYYRDDQSDQAFHRLVYFKKGSETWGNYVGTECSPSLDIVEPASSEKARVRIVPNPLTDQAQIIIDDFSTTQGLVFTLYNLVGSEVFRTNINTASTVLEKNNLPAGLYIYMISGREIATKGKLIIE